MRTFRQIFYGCKKHHLRFFKRTPWYVDRYKKGMRSDWVCLNCYEVISLPIDLNKNKPLRPPKCKA